MKNISLLLILFTLISSCKKENFDIDNLNGNKIGIIGHGGMGIGHTYPMNSLESILNCINLGADGTEIDVQMTKDGVLVAFHGERLEESTNLYGHIFNKTWAEIEGGRYSYPYYGGYRIIRLDDLIKNIPNQEKYIYFLDCKNFKPNKDSTYYNTFNNAIIEIVDKYNIVENTYVEFKNEIPIQNLQEKRPDFKMFIYTSFNSAISIAQQYDLKGITIVIDQLTHEKIELAHSKGIMVATFNTHSHERNIKAVKHNVDFNQTDRLKDLMKILKDE